MRIDMHDDIQSAERCRLAEELSDDVRVQARYLDMRASGESHNMAAMCALQQAPAGGVRKVLWERRS
jgi:hypothetical protein